MVQQHSLVGAHLSVSRGLPAMVQQAVAIGATCAQIFTSSPQQWRSKHFTEDDVAAFHSAWAASGLGPIVSHDAYLINLAASDPELLVKSRQAFSDELARCGLLKLPMVVTHLGAYKGSTLEEGLQRLADSLNALIPVAADAGVQIILETTAGQGTYLGGVFEQFADLFNRIPRYDMLGICLDTCHVFVAGYDLRDSESYHQMWADFDRHIGIQRLRVIHMNDAAKPLGSHGDRHDHIGNGYLGLAPFRLLMRDPRFVAVPKILETPGTDDDHRRNLQVLLELA